MIQDISPHHFDLTYQQREAQANDLLLVFRGDQVMLGRGEQGQLRLPDGSLLHDLSSAGAYLFAIDGQAFFLAPPEAVAEREGFSWQPVRSFRDAQPEWLAFAGITGRHLQQWLVDHEYCGRCGQRMEKSRSERALLCPGCGLTVYPRISPAVIVAVRDGERLLLTRYAGGNYRRFALIAGFVEVGESLEDTIRREVYEETGLRVGSISYFASQPWAFSSSLLAGFFVDLEGSDQVSLNDGELSEARWFTRQELPESLSTISLTATMIEAFRHGEDKR